MTEFTLRRTRTSIRRGQELGRGGEGAVFAVEGQSDRVAKIYFTPPDHRKSQKLIAMTEAASQPLLQIAAWPIDLLTDRHGAIRGFIMPRIIARRDIHELYGPKSRSEAFPEAASQPFFQVAAWQLDLLTDPHGASCGFIMRQIIAGRDILFLAGGKCNTEKVPEPDLRFLVPVSANLTLAISRSMITPRI